MFSASSNGHPSSRRQGSLQKTARKLQPYSRRLTLPVSFQSGWLRTWKRVKHIVRPVTLELIIYPCFPFRRNQSDMGCRVWASSQYWSSSGTSKATQSCLEEDCRWMRRLWLLDRQNWEFYGHISQWCSRGRARCWQRRCHRWSLDCRVLWRPRHLRHHSGLTAGTSWSLSTSSAAYPRRKTQAYMSNGWTWRHLGAALWLCSTSYVSFNQFRQPLRLARRSQIVSPSHSWSRRRASISFSHLLPHLQQRAAQSHHNVMLTVWFAWARSFLYRFILQHLRPQGTSIFPPGWH